MKERKVYVATIHITPGPGTEPLGRQIHHEFEDLESACSYARGAATSAYAHSESPSRLTCYPAHRIALVTVESKTVRELGPEDDPVTGKPLQ